MPEWLTRSSYFSIADRQMESLIPVDELFTQSLLDNVLFYRNALLVPDIFFFISGPLSRHVLDEGGSKSFLAACVADGFVMPAFRGGRSFEGSLAAIRTEGIQGLQPGNVPDKVMAALQMASTIDYRSAEGRATKESRLNLWQIFDA